MALYLYDFTDRMAAGKARAMTRRKRGLSTGRCPGVARYRPTPTDDTTHAHFVAVCELRWQSARDELIESFLLAVYPERYEAFK